LLNDIGAQPETAIATQGTPKKDDRLLESDKHNRFIA
jgi:hypothetical protein